MSATRFALTLAVLASLALAAPAQAKPKPITGKLSKAGYTVIALAANGKARAVKAHGKRFSVVPPASKVTLHLRDAAGIYAGPVVIARKGSKKVVLGVKAGAKLGSVRVLDGYGKLENALATRYVSPSAAARAKQGVPIGAGVFGRVRATSNGVSGAGRDLDGDGLPGAFDVDDDGDLVLDNFERSPVPRARAAQVPPPPGAPPPGAPPPGAPPPASASQFRVFSNFKLDMGESLNANAATVTDAQIDATMARATGLAIQVAAGGQVELDCGGLTYCSTGGTGTAMEGGQPFPGAFDADGDGFGLLTAGPTGDFQLRTGATASQIGTGNAFVERITNDGAETQLPGILNYAFSTTPALRSWSAAGGSSGTVTYPVPAGAPGTPGFPILLPPSGDAIVTLTFWRPQRKAIPGSGEGDGWVDIGRLKYTADVPNGPSGPSPAAGRATARSRATARAIRTSRRAATESSTQRAIDQPTPRTR
jgi:hypothetical protein